MSLESVWWNKLVNVKGSFTELFNRIVQVIQVIYFLFQQNKRKQK